ncbi:hypothetical protein Ga0466249_001302 [Sporomusaceae bacterium BoRhaA]|jgi:hypothetical protein|nr:hypothetical protein [Pelorhabdus rhamnosifermentans]
MKIDKAKELIIEGNKRVKEDHKHLDLLMNFILAGYLKELKG